MVLDPDSQVRREAKYSLTAEQARLAVAAGKNDTQISAFALAPSAPEVVYLAEMNQQAISRDGGKTWNAQTGKTSSRIVALAVSPTNSNVVYAGTESLGLYKSTDGGTTWVAMNQGLGQQPGERLSVTALAIDPQNPERVYAALGTWVGTSHASLLPRGIIQSLDQGQTWRLVDLGRNQVISRLVIVYHKLYALAGGRLVVLRLQNGVNASTAYDTSEVSTNGPACTGSDCR